MTAFMQDLLQAYGHASVPVQLVLQSSLLIVLGLALRSLLHKDTASARHLVLGATFAAVLLLPAIHFAGPRIELPLLQDAEKQTATIPGPAAIRVGNSDATLATVQGTANAVAPQPQSLSMLDVVFWAYIVGLLLALTKLAAGLLTIARLTRHAKPAADSRHRLWLEGQRADRSVRVLYSDKISAPLTWGIFRPVILLPAESVTWSKEEQRHALLHEQAHIRRRDWFVQILSRTIAAIYWFNPLTWIALRNLELEAELAADDQVLAAGSIPDRYARQLVNLTQRVAQGQLPLAATTMAEPRLLTRRVHSILSRGDKTMPLSKKRAYILVSVMATLAYFAGSATLVSAQQHNRLALHEAARGEASTPLIRAATVGDIDAVRELLQAGADVHESSSSKYGYARSPLVAAAQFGNADLVNLLLDAGAEVDRVVRGDATPLIEAARHDHLHIVKLLVARGADVNKTVRGDGSPLIAATRANNADAVNFLLERGADPHVSVPGDENPLFHAAAGGNEQILEALIDAGVDINQSWRGDGTPLIVATRQGNNAAAERLLLAGARADQGVRGDGNAMIVAAQRGETELLREMIASGADVNAAVKGDGSPLIQAARNGHLDAVELLVQAGADLDMVVYGDENALIGAAWQGDIQVVDYLLRAGADPTITAKTYLGKTRSALSQATLGGHEEVIRMLRAAGATE